MPVDPSAPVLVAGAGPAGLSLALTCHQIGVPVRVFESVRNLQALGVGINLQPNAVRELYDLGLRHELPSVGIPTKEWALAARNGRDVWSEPRGTRRRVPVAPVLRPPRRAPDAAAPDRGRTARP